MLPQLSGIPLPTTDTSSDSSRNLNRTLPIGQNVSATVVAVSRDQIQPDIFRLKLEINNRLIQMGVFQALPIGQKINVNRQSDGQIQITPQSPTNSKPSPEVSPSQQKTQPQSNISTKPNISFIIQSANNNLKLPIGSKTTAAVISSRPIYPQNIQTAANRDQAPVSNTFTPPSSASLGNLSTTSLDAIRTPANQSPPLINNAAPPAKENTTTQPVISGNTQSRSTTSSSSAAQTPPPISTSQAQTTSTGVNINRQTEVGSPSTPLINNKAVENKATTPLVTGSQNNSNSKPEIQTSTNTDKQPVTNTNSNTTANSQGTSSVSPRPISAPILHVVTLALNNGSKIEVSSPQAFPQGTQLQIVKSTDNQFQVLQLREPSNTPSSALERPAVQETLRHSLPNQIPTADALSQLSQIAAKAEGPQASQISSVVKSMLQLFGVRPGSPEAPSQIKQNLELGGLSAENNLSKGSAPHPQEMKSQLQQLQKLADSLPAEQKERLEQLLQGIHSRVTSQQLHSLQQWKELPDGGFERVLQLDLPIKNGERWDNLELRLSREGGTNAEGEMISVWRVRLHFDLEEQGGVDAEIRLSDGHEISTLFWCELKETAEKLKERSEEFSERLRQCGFDNTEVNWHEGVAPEQKQAIHKQLVDLHT